MLVFILADEFWGMKVGLVVAVSTGLVELLLTYYKEKKLDRFILLDTILLLFLSALSYLFENEIFFKIKPAMINLVLLSLIALSLFTRIDPLGNMSKRYLNGIQLDENQKSAFRRNLLGMFWLVVVHTILVLWSAFFLSKEIWAFISSFLLFIMMGVYMAVIFLRQKWARGTAITHSDPEEWLPVVDEQGIVQGKALRSYCHNGSKILHPVVHLHLIGNNQTIFLQKRAETKLVQPGKWDTAVGGHLAYGETIEVALKREASEEIGLEDFEPLPILKYRWDTDIESELVYSFVTKGTLPEDKGSDEISESRFWKIREIENSLGKGTFTPNFEFEFKLLKQHGVITSKGVKGF